MSYTCLLSMVIFSYRKKLNYKNWIFHSAVIRRSELCKRDGIMRTRLATSINGYSLRLILLFDYSYSGGVDLILSY